VCYLYDMIFYHKNVVVLILALCVFSPAKAQISITENQSLNFGSIIADTSGDTVTVNPNGTISAQQGSVLDGGHRQAEFLVEGLPNETVNYSFSVGDTLSSASETVDLQNFLASIPSPFSLDPSGARVLSVGADVVIPPFLAGGSFSGNYSITIDNP